MDSSTLTQELQCAICLDTMLDPRALSCQHLFCLRCLFQLANQDRGSTLGISCPFNCGVTATKNGICSLPKNPLVASWCDRARRARLTKTVSSCEYCDCEFVDNDNDGGQASGDGVTETSSSKTEASTSPLLSHQTASSSPQRRRREELLSGADNSSNARPRSQPSTTTITKSAAHSARYFCDDCAGVMCENCFTAQTSTHAFLCSQAKYGCSSTITYPFYLTPLSVAKSMAALSTSEWIGTEVVVVRCDPVYVTCEELEVLVGGLHGNIVGEAVYKLVAAPTEYKYLEDLLDQYPMTDNTSSHLLSFACSTMQVLDEELDTVGGVLTGIEKVMKFSKSPVDRSNSQYVLDTVLFMASFCLEAVVPTLVRLAMTGMSLAVESDVVEFHTINRSEQSKIQALLKRLNQRIALSTLCVSDMHETGMSVFRKCVAVMSRVQNINSSYKRLEDDDASPSECTRTQFPSPLLLKLPTMLSTLGTSFKKVYSLYLKTRQYQQMHLIASLRGSSLSQQDIDTLVEIDKMVMTSVDQLLAASVGVMELHVLWSAMCGAFGDEFENEYLDDILELLLLSTTSYHMNYTDRDAARKAKKLENHQQHGPSPTTTGEASTTKELSTTEDILEMLSPLVEVMEAQQSMLTKGNTDAYLDQFIKLHKRTSGLALKTFNMFGKNESLMVSTLNLVKRTQLVALGNGLVQVLNHVGTAVAHMNSSRQQGSPSSSSLSNEDGEDGLQSPKRNKSISKTDVMSPEQLHHVDSILGVLDEHFGRAIYLETPENELFEHTHFEQEDGNAEEDAKLGLAPNAPRMKSISLNTTGIVHVTRTLIQKLEPLAQSEFHQTDYFPAKDRLQRQLEDFIFKSASTTIASQPSVATFTAPSPSLSTVAKALGGVIESAPVAMTPTANPQQNEAVIEDAEVTGQHGPLIATSNDRQRARDRAIKKFLSNDKTAKDVKVKSCTTIGTRLVPIYEGTMIVQRERNIGNLLFSIWPSEAMRKIRRMILGADKVREDFVVTAAINAQEIDFLFSGQVPCKFHNQPAVPFYAVVVSVAADVANSKLLFGLINLTALSIGLWKWSRRQK